MQAQRQVDVPITMYDLSHQNEQNHHNPVASTEATRVAEISGITWYRLLGLLLAIAGLVKNCIVSERNINAAEEDGLSCCRGIWHNICMPWLG